MCLGFLLEIYLLLYFCILFLRNTKLILIITGGTDLLLNDYLSFSYF